ncbi:MAG TPA: ArsR family transcriptional regulator [Fastidiosipila sp.]|nr:ArsR family transcriptional regulator [Fastidiosipila sp.]
MSKILELMADNEEKLSAVGRALSSITRIQILRLLYYNSYIVKDIASKLNIPASSAALHIRVLEEAELIQIKQKPGSRGSMKLCSRKYDHLHVRLSGHNPDVEQVATVSMPIGAYTDCKVTPTCGIASANGLVGYEDSPSEFFRPERISAQILWSSSGFVEYKFPFPLKSNNVPSRLILSFEACSEAPNFKEDWKSDITISINGWECGTWRSPGDFGRRRGRLNPSWWDNGMTQYGQIVVVEITEDGTMINSRKSSGINLTKIALNPEKPITVKIGNKDEAEYVGGFNLFGAQFGDYAQDILLSFAY